MGIQVYILLPLLGGTSLVTLHHAITSLTTARLETKQHELDLLLRLACKMPLQIPSKKPFG